jgi:hypothetical protein
VFQPQPTALPATEAIPSTAIKVTKAQLANNTDDLSLSRACDGKKLLNTALELGPSIPIYLTSPPNLMVWILWPALSFARAGFFS